jgi:hypothetical protein
MNDSKSSRRDFIKKAAYIAPVVMTLGAKPSFASTGSARCDTGTPNCDTKHDLPDWLAKLIKKIIGRIRGR